MTDPQDENPKIIIDEDWKDQVQREKEDLEHKKESVPKSDAADPDAADPDAADLDAADLDAMELPPATFPVLLTMLATQAMICLGQIPNPASGQVIVDIAQAKHFVDMLEMLEEKTQGNRTAEEIAMLSNLLHQLRLAIVSADRAPDAENS